MLLYEMFVQDISYEIKARLEMRRTFLAHVILVWPLQSCDPWILTKCLSRAERVCVCVMRSLHTHPVTLVLMGGMGHNSSKSCEMFVGRKPKTS